MSSVWLGYRGVKKKSNKEYDDLLIVIAMKANIYNKLVVENVCRVVFAMIASLVVLV